MKEWLPWVVWAGLLCLVLWMVSIYFYEVRSDGNDPFECGFDPMLATRSPVHFHFYNIAILFLVFDLELVTFIPLVLSGYEILSSYWFWGWFLGILLAGVVYELWLGTLDWKE